MPNCQRLWRNDLHFLTALFCFYFGAMTVSCLPSLSSRAELPVGIRTKGSGLYEDSESRDLPSPWGLFTTEWDFSTLKHFRGNDKKRGRADVSIHSLSMKDGTGHLLPDYLTIWKGLHHFFTAPAYWGKGAAILWDLWIRAAEQPCNLKSVILTQLKVKSNFFNSTVWVKNELSQINSINSGVLTRE